MGTDFLFRGVKQLPRREIEKSLTSNAEVRNEWSYASTSPLSLHNVDNDNFIFTFEIYISVYEIRKGR